MSLFSELCEIERLGLKAALCTVVHVSGSTPRKPGAKMVVFDNNADAVGIVKGSIGGGAIEHHIRIKAMEAIQSLKPTLITTSLRNELAMCCGGEMTVFIEPILSRPKFICFGAGHIAQKLVPLANNLGFETFVADERDDLLNDQAFSQVSRKFNDLSQFSLTSMPFSSNTFVVIATHDHAIDQRVVEGVLKLNFAYLALVGSHRKSLMTKKRLQAKGFLESDIERLICPAGIHIAADTPMEIAVSICAQMIEAKNVFKEPVRASPRSMPSRDLMAPDQAQH